MVLIFTASDGDGKRFVIGDSTAGTIVSILLIIPGAHTIVKISLETLTVPMQ